MEIWVRVKEYPNYEVSTYGNIRNIKTLRVLKYYLRNGYPSVSLSNNGIIKTVNIHRIVGISFLEKNDLVINHKDGNKENNHVENLEFVSYKNNTLHAIENKLTKIHVNKVKQYKMENNELIYINEFSSIKEASIKSGISDKHIGSVCRGNRKSTGGYIWKYSDKEVNIINPLNIVGKEIKDFPNYIITKEGKVYSKKRKDYLIATKTLNGYYKIKLCNNGLYKDFYIHKLVKDHFNSLIPDIMET